MAPESVDLYGCNFYADVSGTGPYLVLLHGFGWDSSAWDDQVAELENDFTVIRYDLRGFGRSVPKNEAPFSHSRDLAGIFDHFHIQSAHVLGHSMGGYVAIDFALEYPDMTDSLTLADPAVGGFEWSQDLVEAAFVTPLKLATSDGIEAARQAWLEFPPFNRAMSDPRLAIRIAQMVRRYSGWHWFHPGLAEQSEPPAIRRLPEIACQTLVVLGGANHRDYLRAGRVIQEGIPNARSVTIPNVEHASTMEDPDRFNKEVKDFLLAV